MIRKSLSSFYSGGGRGVLMTTDEDLINGVEGKT